MKKCLVVTDFQNDFVCGTLGFPGAELLEKPITDKIRKYRENGDVIVFTYDTHSSDYLSTQEGQNLPVMHCEKGTNGHELYGTVADEIKSTDLRFEKNCFGSDELYRHLTDTKYESIELVGLVSNICVLANAVLAKTAQPDTPVIVDSACTASFDSGLNDAALAVMKGLQIKVT